MLWCCNWTKINCYLLTVGEQFFRNVEINSHLPSKPRLCQCQVTVHSFRPRAPVIICHGIKPEWIFIIMVNDGKENKSESRPLPTKRSSWFTAADLLHAWWGDTWLGEGWDTCDCVVTRTCHEGGHGDSGTGNRTRIWSGRSHEGIRLTDHAQGLTTAPLGHIPQCPVCVLLLLLSLLLRSHDVAGLCCGQSPAGLTEWHCCHPGTDWPGLCDSVYLWLRSVRRTGPRTRTGTHCWLQISHHWFSVSRGQANGSYCQCHF